MPVRRLIAIALGLLGAWMFWGGLHAVLLITSRGSSLEAALMEPPTSLLRLLGSGLIVIGALIAAFGRPFGAIAAMAGTVLALLLAGLMALAGADSSMWMDDMVLAILFLGLTIGLFVTKRS